MEVLFQRLAQTAQTDLASVNNTLKPSKKELPYLEAWLPISVMLQEKSRLLSLSAMNLLFWLFAMILRLCLSELSGGIAFLLLLSLLSL